MVLAEAWKTGRCGVYRGAPISFLGQPPAQLDSLRLHDLLILAPQSPSSAIDEIDELGDVAVCLESPKAAIQTTSESCRQSRVVR